AFALRSDSREPRGAECRALSCDVHNATHPELRMRVERRYRRGARATIRPRRREARGTADVSERIGRLSGEPCRIRRQRSIDVHIEGADTSGKAQRELRHEHKWPCVDSLRREPERLGINVEPQSIERRCECAKPNAAGGGDVART